MIRFWMPCTGLVPVAHGCGCVSWPWSRDPARRERACPAAHCSARQLGMARSARWVEAGLVTRWVAQAPGRAGGLRGQGPGEPEARQDAGVLEEGDGRDPVAVEG